MSNREQNNAIIDGEWMMNKNKKCVAAIGMVCMGLLFGCGADREAESTGAQESEMENALKTEQDAQENLTEEGNLTEDQESAEDRGSITEDSAGQDEDGDGGQKERKLTQEELAEYTKWLNQRDNYGFLLSDWNTPEQINLLEVFYNGAGISQQATEEQIQIYLKQEGQEELYTDFWVITHEKINDFMLEKLGLTYDELTAKGNLSFEDAYLVDADCFAMEVGDTNYTQFEAVSGTENEEGTIITLHYRNTHLSTIEWVEWVEAGEVVITKDSRQFLSNHIVEGAILDGAWQSSEPVDTQGLVCLIGDEVFQNLHTDADASAVEGSYTVGDWSKITKEALQGTWYYHPSGEGDSTQYDVILQFDGDDAIVYYPSVDFYGDTRYEWDIIDRSERGLCPELAIYWNGRDWGPLAWYILGLSDAGDYFWCNGEVFYKQ